MLWVLLTAMLLVGDIAALDVRSCLSPDLQTHEMSTCLFHAMVIDAGSTGTRLHIFEFSHELQLGAGSPFRLENELFFEVIHYCHANVSIAQTNPGLSFFVGDPSAAAESVSSLLDNARETLPQNMWAHTPLILKATAGLRLLPKNAAQEILDDIDAVFASSPFLVNADSVGLLSGTDEGLFGWFTLNFLLDRINAVLVSPKHLLSTVQPANWTAAALDLGGGSTQVTFRPLLDGTIESAPGEHILDVTIFGDAVNVYTHSYLGNGLIASRLATMRMSSTDGNRLRSPCMPMGHRLEWHYGGDEWVVEGEEEYSFEACEREVSKYIAQSDIHAPAELAAKDIYAFSYFFDRGLQAGLVNDSDGGWVTVEEYRAAARTACTRPSVELGREHWRVWSCFDTTYIYILLSRGYRLDDHKRIHLSKKMRGMETSWALGAAYNTLNTYHASLPPSPLRSACSTAYRGVNAVLSYLNIL